MRIYAKIYAQNDSGPKILNEGTIRICLSKKDIDCKQLDFCMVWNYLYISSYMSSRFQPVVKSVSMIPPSVTNSVVFVVRILDEVLVSAHMCDGAWPAFDEMNRVIRDKTFAVIWRGTFSFYQVIELLTYRGNKHFSNMWIWGNFWLRRKQIESNFRRKLWKSSHVH